MAIRCATCGQIHEELPDIGSDRPAQFWDVAESERERRVELTSDTCAIDGEHFFIRGVLQIPIHGQSEPFGFGVWVSQKRENFLAYVAQPDSASIGPFFGWLSTSISYYPVETMLLKTRAHFRGQGLRPLIELEPTDHPLAIHQREGISLETAWAIVHHYDPPN